jgi:hypothetical protein
LELNTPSITGRTGYDKMGSASKTPGPGTYTIQEKSKLPYYK